MASARNTIIKDLRLEIADLKDHSLAEGMFESIQDDGNLTESDKQKLTQELQVKVNELKQVAHDAAAERGDKEAAAEAIAPEIQKDSKGNVIPSKQLRTPDEIEEHSRGIKPIHVPEDCEVMELTQKEMEKLQTADIALPSGKRKLVGVRPVKPSKGCPVEKYMAIVRTAVLAFFLIFGLGKVAMAAVASDDKAVVGDTWRVTADGDLVPKTNNTYAIGTASAYPSQICLSGSCKTSWGSVISPWEDTGLTTVLTAASTKFVLTHSSGDFAATGFTVGTGEITMENGQTISGTTNNTIKFSDNSDTFVLGFNGTETTFDSSDGGISFLMTQADGHVNFKTDNDSDDYLSITTVANVPTIVTAGTSNLEIAPDGGTTTVTGALTTTGLTTTAGLTSSSTITLQNSETIVNSTNNIVQIGGGTGTTLSVYDAGTADSDATLLLRADASADNGDDWQLVSDGATNGFLIQNDTSGSQATILTLSTAGVLTLTGAVTLSNGETISNATDDTVRIASDDTHTGVDIYSALTSNGTTALNFIGDAGADATDRFQIKNNADGTLTFANDSSVAGTYVTKLTLSSSGLLTLINSETIDNTVDNTITLGSAAAAIIAKVYSSNATNGTASLQLVGDADADATDGWQLQNPADGTLTIGNDSSAAGTYLTKLTVSSTGLLTLVNSETIDNTVDGTVTIGSAGAALIEKIYSSNAANGTAALQIVGDAGADATDGWQIKNHADGTLTIANDSSVAGTYVTKLTVTGSTGDLTATGDMTFQSTLLANGRAGGASTVSSSSTNLAPSSLPFVKINKRVGGGGGLDSIDAGTTLPNGKKGQVLSIEITALQSGGSWVVTPSKATGWTKITFDTLGDSAQFMYVDDNQGWVILTQTGCTVVYQQIP
jgi:hypothetical protein